jgi:hypothetical protein
MRATLASPPGEVPRKHAMDKVSIRREGPGEAVAKRCELLA